MSHTVIQRRKAPYSAKAGDVIPIQIQGQTVFAEVAADLTSQEQEVEIYVTKVYIRPAPKKKGAKV